MTSAFHYMALEDSYDVLGTRASTREQLPGCRIVVGNVRSVGRSIQIWDRGSWVEIDRAEALPDDDKLVLYWDDVLFNGAHVGHVAVQHFVDGGRLHRRLVYAPGFRWVRK